MYFEVYPDIIFIMNLSIDFILLMLLKLINKRRTTIIRLLLAAAAGGITAAIVGILPWMNVIIRFIMMNVIASALMLLIAFGKMIIYEFIKQLISLYLLTYFLGGFINSLYYHTNMRIKISQIGNLLISNLTWKVIMLILLLVIPAGLCVLWLFRFLNNKRPDTLETELIFDEKSITTQGLVDTGNCLYDPVFKKPVIIIENMLLKELIPTEQYRELDMIKRSIAETAFVPDTADTLSPIQHKIRLIPYQSIGKQRGLLLGLVLDKVLIKHGGGIVVNEKVTAAIYDEQLSTGDEYHVILHKELL